MANSERPPRSAEDAIRDTAVDPIDSSAVVLKSTGGEPPVSSENAPSVDAAGPVVFGGRYEARGVLGGGAMGTVYRARDRTLDETVALKLLRSELAVSPELVERFRREVKLARRVTHRNIARVFDIGAHGSQPFLTMELIEGASLADIVTKKGLLPPREVIPIAIELCAGLSAAHQAGVVHRDLKPENVVVQELELGGGRPVITDFGVACALNQRDLPYGATGAFVGSPAYMAPEQVEGAADVDARADVYALGVMLFELLTGQLPWEEGGVFAVAAARLVRPPPDPRERTPGIPDALAEIVLACMATTKEARIASAEEVATRLKKASTLAASASISIPPPTMQVFSSRRVASKAIAIMPITNEASPAVDYFCRGYAAEVADFLSSVTDIKVRLSFLPGGDPRESARVLGVQTFVMGTLRRLPSIGLRLSVRLVTVQDGLTLWSKRFDGANAIDLALAARESATEIGQVLAASTMQQNGPTSLRGGGASTPFVPSTEHSRARDLHKRGRFAYQRAWFESTEEAVRLLEEAHALTPNDPIVAGTLALALARAYGVAGASAASASRARSLAEKALSEAPRLADPRVALAALHAYDGEGVAAAAELRRALTASPDAVEALDWMGRLLVEVGDTERGLAYLDRALALEPSLIGTKLTATLVRGLLGDWDRVTQDLATAPNESQDRVLYMLWRARVALWRNDLKDEAVIAATHDKHIAIATMARVVQTRTIDDEARTVMEQMLPTTDCAPRRAIYNAQIRSEVFAHIGSITDANAALLDADTNGFFDHVWLERCPALAPLRETADFQRVLRNVAARAARVQAALK
jgi:eukaryotic-like serine/threonine-protein kinase